MSRYNLNLTIIPELRLNYIKLLYHATMKTIAVIGTGIMGRGIALNFLKNDYKVIVWNRTKTNLRKFTQKGAQIAKTPKEAVKNADIVFEVTANDQSSEAVWFGKNGILEGADKKKVLI